MNYDNVEFVFNLFLDFYESYMCNLFEIANYYIVDIRILTQNMIETLYKTDMILNMAIFCYFIYIFI